MSGYHGKKYHYYRSDQTIAVDEDCHNELKGHCCFCIEQISRLAQEQRTKKPVSRNINAFLNTGEGGNIYLGVTDDGTIKGIRHTPFQKRHTYESMWNVLARYKPPVPRDRVELFFIPVMDHDATDEKLQQIYECDNSVNQDMLRNRPHAVRSELPCWCERDADAQLAFNISHPRYVIYIRIHPWRAEEVSSMVSPRTHTNLHPIYHDEEGVVYFRLQASLTQYSLKNVFQMTMDEVAKHYSDLTKLEKKKKKQKKQQVEDLSLECCNISR